MTRKEAQRQLAFLMAMEKLDRVLNQSRVNRKPKLRQRRRLLKEAKRAAAA